VALEYDRVRLAIHEAVGCRISGLRYRLAADVVVFGPFIDRHDQLC